MGEENLLFISAGQTEKEVGEQLLPGLGESQTWKRVLRSAREHPPRKLVRMNNKLLKEGGCSSPLGRLFYLTGRGPVGKVGCG
jgi:hypothetical protein